MDNPENIMNEIERIKSELHNLEEELSQTKIKGENREGTVIAVADGKGKIIDFQVKNNKLEQNLKEDLLQSANQALKNSRELAAKRKKEIVGGVNLPEIPGLF